MWLGWVQNHRASEKTLLPQIENQTMLILFFDSKEVEHKDFVPEGQTVPKEFYLEVFGKLLKRTARVRSEVWKNCSFNLCDNKSCTL